MARRRRLCAAPCALLWFPTWLATLGRAVVLPRSKAGGESATLAAPLPICDSTLFERGPDSLSVAVSSWAQEDSTNVHFWNATGITTPLSSEGLQRAVAPHGHLGARGRLRRALHRWMQGGPLRIAVLGCSITKGMEAHGPPWSDRLKRILQNWGSSVGPVKVKNYAHGGTGSPSLLQDAPTVARHLEDADLAIVDFSITDSRTDMLDQRQGSFISRLTGGATNAGARIQGNVFYAPDMMDAVLQQLLSVASDPAVILLEQWAQCTTTGCVDNERLLGDFWASCKDNADVSTYPHWEAARKWGVPVVSYSEGLCAGTADARTWWVCEPSLAEPSKKFADVHWHESGWGYGFDPNSTDSATAIDCQFPHPLSVPTHELMAELLASLLLQEAQVVCSSPELVGQPLPRFDPDIVVAADAWFEHPVVASDSAAHVGYCSSEVSTYLSSFLDVGKFRLHTVTPDDGWQFSEQDGRTEVDVKPGWIASNDGIPHEIVVRVKTGSRGLLTMEYLRSYEKLGNVTCTLGSGNPVTVEGIWQRHASLAAVISFPGALTDSDLEFRCVSDGSKFKIISIIAC